MTAIQTLSIDTDDHIALAAAPHAALAEHVTRLWSHEAASRASAQERVLPSGSADLVFDLRDDTRAPRVCGPHAVPFGMVRGGAEAFVGVQFTPGGAAALLGVPQNALANARVELASLWGDAPAQRWRDALLRARGPQARVRTLERLLLGRLATAREGHTSVAFALQQLLSCDEVQSIGGIVAATGLSARRFIQLFTREVGLPPKLFARVRRFQRVLALTQAQRTPNWCDVALACGYHDQAHMHRDFGEFAEVTPARYLRARGVDPSHVAVRR